MKATTTIPIVMVSSVDPIGNGLVASLARPGGQDLITDQAGETSWVDRLARIFGEIEPALRAERLI